MRVPESQTNATHQLLAQKAKQIKAAADTKEPTAAAATTAQAKQLAAVAIITSPGDSSTISGHTLLMSRVMRAENPKVEPPVIKEFNETTRKLPTAHFLTTEDRITVAKVFEYAQQQGSDLGYVDQLAGALAQYRKSNNGEQMSMVDIATIPGRTKKYEFTSTDKATIERILNSEAFKSTELDAGFIRHATDKNHAHVNHTDFNFLEQVVTKFSAQSDKAEAMGSRFNRYSGPKDYRPQPLNPAVPVDKKKVELIQSDPTRKWGAPATFSLPTIEHIFRTISKVFGRNAHPGLYEILSDRTKRD